MRQRPGGGHVRHVGARPPMAAFFQRRDDRARHIAGIVLGQHGRGDKPSVRLELAFDDDALALAEQIGKHAPIGDGDVVPAVGDAKGDAQPVALDALQFDEPADPQLGPRLYRQLPELAWGVEEDEVVAEGGQDQRRRGGEQSEPDHQREQSLRFAAHRRRCRSISARARWLAR
jgi:hypothetical protein